MKEFKILEITDRVDIEDGYPHIDIATKLEDIVREVYTKEELENENFPKDLETLIEAINQTIDNCTHLFESKRERDGFNLARNIIKEVAGCIKDIQNNK